QDGDRVALRVETLHGDANLEERVSALDLGRNCPVGDDVEAASRRRLCEQNAGRLDALTRLAGDANHEITDGHCLTPGEVRFGTFYRCSRATSWVLSHTPIKGNEGLCPIRIAY